MIIKVIGESVFSVPVATFGISGSESGYTLQYSVTGESYTDYDTPVDADTEVFVNFGLPNGFYKLSGNTGEVTIKY